MQKALIESKVFYHFNKVRELRQAFAAGKQTTFLIGMTHISTKIGQIKL